MFRRPLKIKSRIFLSFGVRCSGVPKTPKNQILNYLYSLSWCSDVAFLIVGYRSGAPLVFQRPQNFPFQIFFSGSVRCSGVPKTPKFQISDVRLFLFGVRPTELGVHHLVHYIVRKSIRIFLEVFRKRFVRFALSKNLPEIRRTETIHLVRQSSNFEPSRDLLAV